MTHEDLKDNLTLLLKSRKCPLTMETAASVLSAIAEAGCVVVPEEPTDKMILHAGMALGEMAKAGELSKARPYEILKPQWDAMLSASPFLNRSSS